MFVDVYAQPQRKTSLVSMHKMRSVSIIYYLNLATVFAMKRNEIVICHKSSIIIEGISEKISDLEHSTQRAFPVRSQTKKTNFVFDAYKIPK